MSSPFYYVFLACITFKIKYKRKYYTMKFQYFFLLVTAIIIQLSVEATEIVVTEGQNLQEIINNANGGDVILIEGGKFDAIHLSDRNFTMEAPLVIKGANEIPIIENPSISSGRGIHLNNVSYIVFDSLKIVGGMWGIQGFNADNIIIKNCEITGQGQEGIQIRNGSEYVDIINCHIHDIGLYNPQWGEGIYLGGDKGGNEYLWIENCTIYECGRGEAINVKSGSCKYVTITDNYIHDIHPGTQSQWNGGAIAVDQHNSTEDKKIWIQNNLIDGVYGGETSNTGIMTQQTGTRVLYNTINNCEDRGIWFNDYNSDAPCWHYGNTFSDNGQDIYIASGADVYNEDIGISSYSPQSWYGNGELPLSITTTALPYAITKLPYHQYIDAAGGSGNYYWNIEGNLPEGIKTNEDADKLFLSGIPLASGIFNISATVEDDHTAKNKVLQLHVANIDTSNLANQLTLSEVMGDLEPSHPVSGLWDGDWTTNQEGWPGGRTIDSFVVAFDFKKVIPLSEIRLFGDNEGTWYCSEFTVEQRSDTAESWEQIISGENCFGAQWFAYDVNTEARYIRLTVIGNTGLHRTQVREFEIYSKIKHRYLELTQNPFYGGTVHGSGEYLKDSLATISATPNEGFVFTGWYSLDEQLISEDADYSFILSENTSLEARFSKVSSAFDLKHLAENVVIYPNPVTNMLHYESSMKPVSVKIKNIQGSTLIYLLPDHLKETIDISGLEAGVYLVEFIYNEGSVLKKIVIQ